MFGDGGQDGEPAGFVLGVVHCDVELNAAEVVG